MYLNNSLEIGLDQSRLQHKFVDNSEIKITLQELKNNVEKRKQLANYLSEQITNGFLEWRKIYYNQEDLSEDILEKKDWFKINDNMKKVLNYFPWNDPDLPILLKLTDFTACLITLGSLLMNKKD